MLSEGALIQRLSDLVGADHIVAGPGAARYVVDSKLARAVVFPGSVEEVSTTMAFASAEGLKVVPRGSGTKMALGGIPDRVDLVVVLSRLNGVVDYEPADMTATFRAGSLLKEAQAVLGRNGQFIGLDPPYADLATLGGILATNSSGPRRLRYGASRDLVIAIRVVHADGKVTKGGAKVVKNVTGYDMNKLYIGSLGTLGIIVEATFRLHPMPAVERTCLASLDSVDAARDVVARILDSPLVPFAVELLNPEASRRVAEQAGLPWPKARCGLAVAIGSIRPEAVDAQLETVRRLCGDPAWRLGPGGRRERRRPRRAARGEEPGGRLGIGGEGPSLHATTEGRVRSSEDLEPGTVRGRDLRWPSNRRGRPPPAPSIRSIRPMQSSSLTASTAAFVFPRVLPTSSLATRWTAHAAGSISYGRLQRGRSASPTTSSGT